MRRQPCFGAIGRKVRVRSGRRLKQANHANRARHYLRHPMRARLPAFVLNCLLLSVLLNGLLASLARAQAPRVVRTLGVVDRLAHRIVHCFYQDRAGFLWIGTENGLDRYDGYELRSFARLSGRTLPNPTVWAVTEDAAGRLLLGTTGGLYAYDRAGRSLQEVALGVHVGVTALARAPDGAVWAGTQFGEVYRVPPAGPAGAATPPVMHVRLSVAAAGRLTRTVIGIHPQADGGALVETYLGRVAVLAPDGRERQVIVVPGQPLRLVRAEVGGGWLLASREGVYRAAPDPDTPPRRLVTLPHAGAGAEAMFSIGADRWGSVWFGPGPDEIQRLDPASGRLDSVGAVVRPLLGGPFRVQCFFEDRSGNIWVGTNQGVAQLDNQRPRFATLAPPPRQWLPGSVFSTRGLVETSDGALYVGSYAGFFRLDPTGAWQRLRWLRDGREFQPTVYGLWADSATGEIWIAGEGPGLVRYQPAANRFVQLEPDEDATTDRRGHHATCLLPDARNRLWVGSYTDLRLYDRTTGRRLAILDAPARWLNASELRYRALVAVPGGGDVWAATELGLFRLDAAGQVRHHWGAGRGGLPVNDVLSVWPAPGGRYVWVGTRGGGLGRLDLRTNRWRIWRQTDGLPDDLVCAVLPEGDSALWLATQRGLSRMSWRTGQFSSFFARDGLAGDEFNHGSALRRRNGRFLFGGVAGLSEVPPSPAPTGGPAISAAPPLLLTGLSTYDGRLRELPSPAPGAPPLTLPAEGGFLSVQFALVDFRETGQHQYAYQLGGRTAPWLSLGAERTLRLAGLPAGLDTLRIRGAGPDGSWSRHELRLPLRVVPPLWQRGWFLALLTVVGGGVLYGLHRLRVRQLLAVERVRTQIAANLHDDVGSL